jgi:hypothetical protein
VIAYVPDLMDRSRLGGLGDAVTYVGSVDELATAGADDTVIVDLGRSGAVEAAGAAAGRGARVIGFASHVDEDLLRAAAAAGIEALPRSRFFKRVGDLA